MTTRPGDDLTPLAVIAARHGHDPACLGCRAERAGDPVPHMCATPDHHHEPPCVLAVLAEPAAGHVNASVAAGFADEAALLLTSGAAGDDAMTRATANAATATALRLGQLADALEQLLDGTPGGHSVRVRLR